MEVSCSTVRIPVTESSQVGEARRTAAELAGQIGLDATQQGRLAIVASEAATNLVRHSRGGEVLLQVRRDEELPGVELLALDKGPGIVDPLRSMRDGVSSGSTPGNGLGAMQRLSHRFDLYSMRGIGTAVLSRMRFSKPASPGMEYGGVALAKRGEEVCGDAFAVAESGRQTVIMLADGLGHGSDAAAAAQEALRMFRRDLRLSPVDIVKGAHGALRSTRGAAVAVAKIDLEAGLVRYAGLGNISAVILSPEGARHLVSHNGILGHEMRKVQEFQYPWPRQASIIMHSDGLSSRWDLDRYPGLVSRDPSLIAAVLYRDFERGRDDVSVVVAREAAA